MQRRWIVGLAVIAFVTVLFVYWLSTVDIQGAAIWAALAAVHPLAVVAAIALGAFEMILRALRFRRALAHFGHPLSARRAWVAHVVGFFGGGLTPLRLGEVGKAVFLRARDALPLAAGVAANVVERLFDFVAISLLLLLSVLAITGLSSPLAFVALALLVVFLALYAALLLLPTPLLRECGPLRFLGPTIAAKLRGWLPPLVTETDASRSRLTAEMAGCSAAIVIVDLTVLLSLLAGLGTNADVARVGFAIGLGTLAGIASLLLGGLAVTEASYTVLLVQGDVPPAIALVAVLLARLLTFYPYMVLGWAYGVREVAVG